MPAASPPKRKPAARKPAAHTPVVQSVTDFEPLRFDTADTPEVDRLVIAYLDDYELTMPAEVPPNVALKIMRTARRRGDEAAMNEMLEEVVGEEGFDRLVNHRGLTTENLVDLFKVVQEVAMGRLEVPKASSRNA